jgi:hypothetical protein
MRPRTKKIILTIASVLGIVLGGFALLVGYAVWDFHRQHPYGWSHCCDLQLHMALRQYATTHGGAFPAGQATPEASLSLLYREKADYGPLASAGLLRGKTVPESVVKEILDRGDLLTPETCGWHYVEGLRLDDDYRLALFWDKAGLDHNGGLMPQGGHIVLRVNGTPEHIPEADWEKFREEQRKLLAERKTAIHHDATVQIDNREVKVQVRVVDDGIYGATWDSSQLIATTKARELGIQGLPVIPIEEIRNAKVVVEQAGARPVQQGPNLIVVHPESPRVRFVLQGREIVYDRSGFHIQATTQGQTTPGG